MEGGELLVEKRKYPRWVCPLDVKYKILKNDKLGKFKEIFQKTKDIKTGDVSGSGALLITEELLKTGDRISMNIYLSSSDSKVKVIAEVVRVFEKEELGRKKYYTGVKFIDIQTESDEILQELIERKLNESKKINLTKEEALKIAQQEYFLRLLNEELRARKI